MKVFTSVIAVLSFFTPFGVADVCTPRHVAVSMFGNPSAAKIAEGWTNQYNKQCFGGIKITIDKSTNGNGNSDAAQAVCGYGKNPVNVGLLSRKLKPTEASASVQNPYRFTCSQGLTTRQLTEVQIAIDGIAFVAAKNGVAANCIASLPGGGLSFSQIRWIYSSFTHAKLLADPTFDPTAVPNPDGYDNTHKWSELCLGATCNCPAEEIDIVGFPATSDEYLFFANTFMSSAAELVRSGYKAPFSGDPGDYVLETVLASGHSARLGFTSFSSYNSYLNYKLYAASIKSPHDGVYRFPKSYLAGSYPASFYLFMYVADSSVSALYSYFNSFAFTTTGSYEVADNGLLPIPDVNQVQMKLRITSILNKSVLSVQCGPSGSLLQGGSSIVYPLAYIWSGIYSDACGVDVSTIAGGDAFGARLACGIREPATGQTADVGLLSRPFTTSEAVLPSGGNGYDYKCLIGTQGTVREIPAAIQAILFFFPYDGTASKCIPSLPGKGLTMDQLRWMFSSFMTAQLAANGWNSSSVPNSDGNDNTHLWSELGGSGCLKTEIAIAGPSSDSDVYSFFANVVLTANGETIAMNRPNGVTYFSYSDENGQEIVDYVDSSVHSIGIYARKPPYYFGTASIQNKDRIFVAPSDDYIADGSYNPFSRQVYFELATDFSRFPTVSAYANFGINTPLGDAFTHSAGFFSLSNATKVAIGDRFTISGIQCFSGFTTVQVMDKGVTVMKDLKIGDRVLNANGKFDKVYSFGHYAPDMEAEFIRIHAAALKAPLEISKEHMLFVGGAAVPASAVVVGDKVDLANGGIAVVTKITTVARKGVHAPFTKSGTIAVNGVASSVYVDLQNKHGMLMVGDYTTPFSMQFVSHMFQALHRLACKISPVYCSIETYDERGMSGWVRGPFALAKWLVQQNVVVMTLILVPCLLVGAVVSCIESFFFANQTMLLVTAVVSLIVTVYFRLTIPTKKVD